MRMRPQICVIGAGVIGLSTAYYILETIPNVNLTIIAESFSPHTTSNVAAGFWRPYCLGKTPQHKVEKWSTETWDYLLKLCYAPEGYDAGVFLSSGRDVHTGEVNEPFWKNTVLGYRRLTKQELSVLPDRYAWGFFFTNIIADPKKYLPYLMGNIQAKGGQIIQRKVISFADLGHTFDIIVNCTGLGAQHLCKDDKMTSVRGHVVRAHAPWIKHFTIAEDDLLHIICTSDEITMGMTGGEDSNPALNLDERNRILQGCLELEPSLVGATNLMDHLGFRPGRSEVRLEVEPQTIKGRKIPVVHNYGHGGSGITLHWGCAKESTQLVQTLITKAKL